MVDPFEAFKQRSKAAWAGSVSMETLTAAAAPKLMRFAGVASGAKLLDVACGTGVAALTAARLGAEVTGVDLAPPLLERARQNAAIMRVRASFVEGDVEALPFSDASFDLVISQFGHMFAPRPKLAVSEMLRVLKPGGTLAFSTWPPELYMGRFLAFMGRFSPNPPPEGAAPPPLWGNPEIVRERLGDAVHDLVFDRDRMHMPVLSPEHLWAATAQSAGPMAALSKKLESRPDELEAIRSELVTLATTYFEDNTMRQDFLLTRAKKN